MSEILATWEAEFGRIMVQSQLGKTIVRPHLNNNNKKAGHGGVCLSL
jgi:hypothetical protein